MSKSSQLKVGDRMAVYGGIPGTEQVVDGDRGKVMRSAQRTAEGCLTVAVRFDDGKNEWNVHPKQCRRLRPAKPRRSVWLKMEQVDRHYYPPDIAWLEDAADFEYTEFREVRPRRKP